MQPPVDRRGAAVILVTGAAGFIGYHLVDALCARGEQVVGIDNINEYYDPALKLARLARLERHRAAGQFTFEKLDLCDYDGLRKLFAGRKIDRICHLAAQAGVRYSLTAPFAYQKSNNEGFLNIIECARHGGAKNFVYASSSSVYGSNTKLPFSEDDRTDTPLSLYAATKKANELVAHCYSSLYGLNCSGLRFFTVYGPWGRPDMALFIFTKAIIAGETIDVYNNGRMKRNFTYIDDIVRGAMIALDNPVRCEVYNLGNNRAEELMDFIGEIELNAGRKAVMKFLPMQQGDVVATVADISKIARLGYAPTTNIDTGIRAFVKWYREYYRC
ncbi:MAG: GDP-mannose 4,6-dehydratase [Chitinispirillaceae bacterium]|nr:GDP-mannose 4,6-dehydratase [Chitinispirillaceae bacterium]